MHEIIFNIDNIMDMIRGVGKFYRFHTHKTKSQYFSHILEIFNLNKTRDLTSTRVDSEDR